MSDRLAECLTFTLVAEGGFVDDPQDPGGATNKGVTLATFRSWRHDPTATVAQLQRITAAELQAIYGSCYWQPPRCQDMPLGIDLMVFDHAVNAGVRRSSMLLQQAVGVDQDGWVGAQTLAAVRSTGMLVDKLAAVQGAYYRGLPGFARFGRGWLARLDRRVAAAKAVHA